MTSFVINKDKVCQESKLGSVIIPNRMGYAGLTSTCAQLKGHVTYVTSKSMQQHLFQTIQHTSTCGSSKGSPFTSLISACNGSSKYLAIIDKFEFWAGWSDEETEGIFRDSCIGMSLEKIGYEPWEVGEPSGQRKENCIVASGKSNDIEKVTWQDVSCSKKYCGFCNLERAPLFTIRGMYNNYHRKIEEYGCSKSNDYFKTCTGKRIAQRISF